MHGKKSSNNNIIWLALAVILIGATAAVGYTLTLKDAVSMTRPADLSSAKPTPPAEEFKRVPEGGAKIDTVSGTIISLDDGQGITIKNAQVSVNPDDPQGPPIRTVLFAENTMVVAQIPLTNKEIDAAHKQYQADLKAGKSVQPPAPFKEETLAPDGLRLTMNITVTSDEDIRNAKTLTARKISFLAPPSSVSVAR